MAGKKRSQREGKFKRKTALEARIKGRWKKGDKYPEVPWKPKGSPTEMTEAAKKNQISEKKETMRMGVVLAKNPRKAERVSLEMGIRSLPGERKAKKRRMLQGVGTGNIERKPGIHSL